MSHEEKLAWIKAATNEQLLGQYRRSYVAAFIEHNPLADWAEDRERCWEYDACEAEILQRMQQNNPV